jgi:predicted ribosomally synthesized peptide with nif11-like leader
MSQEAALAVAERMKSDQGFRDEVGAAGDDEARLAVITAAGFDVEAGDKDTLVSALAASDGELSDAQLEGVSGAGDGGYDGDPCKQAGAFPPGFPG